MKVGIIGAGPAGLTAAYELSKLGVEVELFESSPFIGGMSRSLDLWGQKVDLGPHRFFSDDPRVNRIWLEIAADDYDIVNRLTRILYKGKFFYYPLKVLNVLTNLGLWGILCCLASYAKELIRPTPLGQTPSFEEWVVRRFGRKLFTIFFKTYSEKLWGIRCSELDADFAAQRIKKFSLLEIIKGVFGGGKKKHKTLVEQFAYPHGATGSIYERMAEKCKEKGGQIHLNTPVQRVIVCNQKAVGIEFHDGRVELFDQIISSMPLTDLVGGMDNLTCQVKDASLKLRFRNTVIVFLKVNAVDLFKDNWLYVHSTELATGRITNFRNWTKYLYKNSADTVLALEYWCYNDDKLWQSNDLELVSQATAEIQQAGLLGAHAVSDGQVVRIGKSYPVYTRGYKEPLKVVVDFLKTIDNLFVIEI